MNQIETPLDDLAAAFFCSEERLTTLRAIDLRMISGVACGRRYVKRNGKRPVKLHCGGKRTVVTISPLEPEALTLAERERTLREVCNRCWSRLVAELGPRKARDAWERAAWNEDLAPDRVILRGEIQVNARPMLAEDVIAEVLDHYARVRRLFRERPRGWTRKKWRFALAAWKAYLDPHVGSYAAAAELGLACAPGVGLWTEDSVRRAIGAARAVIAQRHSRLRRMEVAA